MKEINRHASVYPIGVVKNLTDLSKRQIRYYEETELVIPERTSGNHRMYSLADVEKLLRIKKLLEQGLNIEDVREELARRERREVDTNVLSHLQSLAKNRDLKSKFKNALRRQSIRDSKPERNVKDGSPTNKDSPPQTSTKNLQSLYPLRNRPELVKTIENRRKER